MKAAGENTGNVPLVTNLKDKSTASRRQKIVTILARPGSDSDEVGACGGGHAERYSTVSVSVLVFQVNPNVSGAVARCRCHQPARYLSAEPTDPSHFGTTNFSRTFSFCVLDHRLLFLKPLPCRFIFLTSKVEGQDQTMARDEWIRAVEELSVRVVIGNPFSDQHSHLHPSTRNIS